MHSRKARHALKWTRPVCRRFVDDVLRLQFFALANILRRLMLPPADLAFGRSFVGEDQSGLNRRCLLINARSSVRSDKLGSQFQKLWAMLRP